MPPAKKTSSAQNTTLQSTGMDVIKQYPGPLTVSRAVKVDVPGKHFPQLTGAEQKASYTGTAVEFTERHTFARHLKAWGAAHTGPGIRFICDSDAIDDPDHKGFWTPLWLWNRWRHETYKDNREAEMQYLDKMPETADAPAPGDAKPTKKPPEVKNYFTKTGSGTHTVGGEGKTAGQVQPCTYYACKKPGCLRGPANPIKQVGSGTSDAAASAAPSLGSAGPSTSGHAADPPSADPLGGVDMSLLQRAGVLGNTPYAAA